jgi:hypothetical protein
MNMRKFVIGAAAIGLVATGAVAGAVTSVIAQEAGGGDINACVSRGGAIRIVAAGEACKTSPSSQAETPLSWPSEDSGAVAGAHRVFAIDDVLDSTDAKEVQVMCPPGEIALGGGHNIGRSLVESTAPISVTQSLPVLDGDSRPVGWSVQAVEVVPYEGLWRPVAVAVCAPSA